MVVAITATASSDHGSQGWTRIFKRMRTLPLADRRVCYLGSASVSQQGGSHAGSLSTSRRQFFFYSNEGSPREPVHVHAGKDDCEAKLWLEPSIAVAYNDGYNSKQLRELLEFVKDNEPRIKKAV